MTSNAHILLEGSIKHRDNRKWKNRWAVVSKLSPVADCLYINLYRSCKDKLCNAEPKCIIMVEGYLGCESGFQLDRESNTLAIICTSQTVLLAFDTHEILYQWQEKLQQHFCKEQYYLVHIISIPAKSKLTCGPARLLLQDFLFCLVSGIPPRLLCHWPIKHLRRFGAVDGKFCFEGGSQSGKGAGLYVLYTNQSEEISKCFELASNGQLNSLTEPNEQDRLSKLDKILYKSKYSEKRPNNSNSDSSSNCDSYSHTTIEDPYYKSDFYNSSISIKSDMPGCFEDFSSTLGRNRNRCKCVSSFSSNTISRTSNIKCYKFDEGRVAPSNHHPTSSQPCCCSPSTVSLAAVLTADRESLFSQSSHGSGSSGSGGGNTGPVAAAALDHNRFINHTGYYGTSNDYDSRIKSQSTPQPPNINHKCNDYSFISKCNVPRKQEDIENDEPVNACQQCKLHFAKETNKLTNGHLYSQIDFREPPGDPTANYDIPRNLCVLRNSVCLSCRNKDPSAVEAAMINHCKCDDGKNAILPSTAIIACKTLRESGASSSHDKLKCMCNQKGANQGHCRMAHCVHDNETSTTASAVASSAICSSQRNNGCEIECTPCLDALKQNQSQPPLPPRCSGSTTTLVPKAIPSPPQQPDCCCCCCCGTVIQSNYENMHFINTIDLYENMRFVRETEEAEEEKDVNRHNCDQPIGGNCECQPDNEEQDKCGPPVNADESLTVADNNNGMQVKSMNGGGVWSETDDCGKQRVRQAEEEEKSDGGGDKAVMIHTNGELYEGQNNNDSKDDNGDHQVDEPRYGTELDISLSNNRVNYGEAEREEEMRKENDSSMANQINSSGSHNGTLQQNYCCRVPPQPPRSKLTKSYSIDDIWSMEQKCGIECSANPADSSAVDGRARKMMKSDLFCSEQSIRIEPPRHRSGPLLENWNKPNKLNWDSKDFCTSSQITILCRNQN